MASILRFIPEITDVGLNKTSEKCVDDDII